MPTERTPVHKHHYHSPIRRGLYSLALVTLVLVVGTVGIHRLEGFSYADSFFFVSMIATGQGPVGPLAPTTVAGKMFTSLLAFVSVGSMIAAFAFLFGPFLGKLWRIGVIKLEEELGLLNKHKGERHD